MIDWNEFAKVLATIRTAAEQSVQYGENGEMLPNHSYMEIHRLKVMLDDANVPESRFTYECKRMFDGWQIVFYDADGGRIGDVVEHFGSYGHEADTLEIMDIMTDEEREEVGDDVIGWLKAEDVFERIMTFTEGHEDDAEID